MNDTVTERRSSSPELPSLGRRRLLSASLGLGPTSEAPTGDAAPPAESVVDKRRYSVNGLASRDDARRLERRLERLDGVVSARVRFDDGTAVIGVHAPRAGGTRPMDAELDDGLAFVAACAGVQLVPRAEPPPSTLVQRELQHAEISRATLLTSAFAIALALLRAGHAWADVYLAGSREVVTAAEVVLVCGAIWCGRSLFQHARSGFELVPRGSAAIFTLAVSLSVSAACVDFFADENPRFDVPAILLAGYHATVLMMYLVLRDAEAPYRRLLRLRPEKALIRRDGVVVRVRARDVVAEDRVEVGPDEVVPVDGVIVGVDGACLVDTSELLGSGGPEPRKEGDPIYAGSVNRGERMVVEPTGKETTLLVRLLRAIDLETHRSAGRHGNSWASLMAALVPAPLAAARHAIEARYEGLGARHTRLVGLAVLVAIAATFARGEAEAVRSAHSLLGPAVAILVLGSAFALAWSPVAATLSAVAAAARRGVLFRDATALESLNSLDVVAFSGAGTLTTGRLTVESVTLYSPDVAAPTDEREALLLAIAAEHSPDEPVSVAVRDYVAARYGSGALGEVPEARSFRRLPGQGVIATVEEREVVVGRARLISAKGIPVPGGIGDDANTLVVATRRPGFPTGVVATIRVADPVRPECVRSRLIPERRCSVRLLVPAADPTSDGLARRLECGDAEIFSGDAGQHADAVAALVASGKRVAVVGDVEQDALALDAATSSVGIVGHDATLGENVDVLLLRPGVAGWLVARSAARTARLGRWLGVASGFFSLAAFVPAWTGLLGPAAATGITLFLVVVSGLVIRLNARR